MPDEKKPDEKTPEEFDVEAALKNEAVQTAIADAVKTATEGLEVNRDSILAEKRQLSDQLKEAKEFAEKFKDLDVDKVRVMMEAANKSEEAKMISEGKIDEVIAARTQSVKAGYEQQFQEKDGSITELQAKNQALQDMYENKLIGDAVQAEAIRQGMLPDAIADAIGNSQGIFKLDDDGNVVSRKAEDFINSPERFVKSLKETKAYYWPANADFKLSGSGGSITDIQGRMETAAKAGDFDTYKALRAKQTGQK